MQAQNWHNTGRKTGHGGPDLAHGPPVWHPRFIVKIVFRELSLDC